MHLKSILHTNGFIENYDLEESKFEYNFEAMQKAIDCGCIDIVHAEHLPSPYCLVVDDEALLKEQPVINVVASWLYGTADHGQPLCGDVLIMKDKITPDGVETVGLDDDDFKRLYNTVIYGKDTVTGIADTIAKVKSILEGGKDE